MHLYSIRVRQLDANVRDEQRFRDENKNEENTSWRFFLGVVDFSRVYFIRPIYLAYEGKILPNIDAFCLLYQHAIQLACYGATTRTYRSLKSSKILS